MLFLLPLLLDLATATYHNSCVLYNTASAIEFTWDTDKQRDFSVYWRTSYYGWANYGYIEAVRLLNNQGC